MGLPRKPQSSKVLIFFLKARKMRGRRAAAKPCAAGELGGWSTVVGGGGDPWASQDCKVKLAVGQTVCSGVPEVAEGSAWRSDVVWQHQ